MDKLAFIRNAQIPTVWELGKRKTEPVSIRAEYGVNQADPIMIRAGIGWDMAINGWNYHGNLSRIEGGRRGCYKRQQHLGVARTRFHLLVMELLFYGSLLVIAYLGVIWLAYSGL